MDVTLIFVFKTWKLRFRHAFLTGWGSPAICKYSNTLFEPQSSKQINGEGMSVSVASSISRFDPCDFFPWDYIEDHICCENVNNMFDKFVMVGQI